MLPLVAEPKEKPCCGIEPIEDKSEKTKEMLAEPKEKPCCGALPVAAVDELNRRKDRDEDPIPFAATNGGDTSEKTNEIPPHALAARCEVDADCEKWVDDLPVPLFAAAGSGMENPKNGTGGFAPADPEKSSSGGKQTGGGFAAV